MLSYSDIIKNKKSILFVTAHPDDIDVFFSGTIALLRRDNIDCRFLILTSGDLAGSGKDREFEQLKSLDNVKIPKENVDFARLKDGFLESDHETIATVVQAIRKWQPDIVATFDPRSLIVDGKYVMHRDHRNCGQAAIDAVYPYARVADYRPEMGKDFTVKGIFLCDPSNPNTEIDFTEVIETKRKMLSTHVSQFTKEDIDSILDSYNDNGKYLAHFEYIELGW